jgi:diguanylate cyclase (GGDEF)-like protein
MKENEDRLYHLIHYDTLTELPNRVKINDRIDLLISLLSHKKMGFSLFYVDLDHFKRINDSVSHHVGDLMLQAVSSRLRLIIHPDDMIGRLGGDEFAVVVQRQLKEEELLLYSEGIRNSLSEMFTVENMEYSISASFGIAMYPSDGEDAAELMKNAETAMYKAKEFGRNGVQFFRREMKDDIMRRVKYENGLMASIQNNELYLVFQPQYNTKTKKLRGFESLARWENDTLGAVSPVQFIPVAEEGGFIVPLGEWILETACNKLNLLLEIYGKELIMSVNISAVQIMSPSFVNSVKRILTKTKCNPKNMEFEITESVMISSVDHVIKVLNELKDFGIHIALDDFGTGYSSLSYLQMLPIETLKIDKSFVDNMQNDENHRIMVGSIISLVHQMDMEVVAEGVDNLSQLEFLNNFQCDFIQGFIWGYPLREEEVLKLLRELNDEDLLIP